MQLSQLPWHMYQYNPALLTTFVCVPVHCMYLQFISYMYHSKSYYCSPIMYLKCGHIFRVQGSALVLVSFPDPTLEEGWGLVYVKLFLGL